MEKGGGGKGDKGAWKGDTAKGYTYIPIGPQWKAAAGSAGVPFPGPRQWAHPLQPAGGKGLSWCQEQPAGYMLSMCRPTTTQPTTATTTTQPATAEKDARAPAEGAVADEKRDGEASALPFATTKRDWRRPRKTSLATFLNSGQCASGCCGEPSAAMPRTFGEVPLRAKNGRARLSTFTEKPKQSLRPLHSNGGDDWEVIDAILDSGASVTVIPPHMAAGHPVQESAASRAGVQYEVANGEEIPNLGEKLFAVVTEEGTVRGMKPQVADVSKALQSVRALVRTGHLVVFGDGADGTEHYILNRESGEVNAVRDDGFNYLLRLYVVPPSAQQPFAGQAEAR